MVILVIEFLELLEFLVVHVFGWVFGQIVVGVSGVFGWALGLAGRLNQYINRYIYVCIYMYISISTYEYEYESINQ